MVAEESTFSETAGPFHTFKLQYQTCWWAGNTVIGFLLEEPPAFGSLSIGFMIPDYVESKSHLCWDYTRNRMLCHKINVVSTLVATNEI